MSDKAGCGGVDIGLAVSLIIICAMIGLWDVFAPAYFGADCTVSAVLHRWAMMFPPLPLAVGVVLGHVFWPVR